MIAWDTETRNFRWWDNSAFIGTWSTDGETGNVAGLPAGGTRPTAFKRVITSDKHHACANCKFDLHMFEAATKVNLLAKGYRADDVLTMSRLWFGARRNVHGLKELATDLIDADAAQAEKDMQEKYKELTGKSNMDHEDSYYITWQTYKDVVEHYAKLDAVYTYRLYEILWPKIQSDPKLAKLYELEREVQTVLYEAERIGVRIDPEAVQRLTEHYHERESAAREALQHELGFIPEGEGSEDALREALVKAGVPLTERTEKTGELAINRKALAQFSDHPAVSALFEYRRVGKFLSTYIGPLANAGDLVHTNFKQAEAWTGRMASATPNMQNLPKRTELGADENLKIRSVFVPRPGMGFIIADFDSIEMRVLAHFLGDPEYQEMIANGDPHAMTAAAAWGGVPMDYVKGTPNRWLRDIAKQATYGIVYGGGGPVIQSTINRMVVDVGHPEYVVNLEQARDIRRKITATIPGFKELTDSPWKGRTYPQGRIYQQLMKSQEGNYGYVRTLLGRKQWINLEKAYVGLSGLIQGSAADIMKQAAVNIYEAMKPYGAYPLLFVHDEAVVEAPADELERLQPIVVEAMEAAAEITPRLAVEAHTTLRSYAHSD